MTFQNFIFLQILSTAMMVGVIWQVQLVSYPSFVYLCYPCLEGEDALKDYHLFYTNRISWIVIPLMFIELFLSLATVFFYPNSKSIFLLMPVLLSWVSTFFISVPLHQKIQGGDFLKSSKQLVRTNWIRTCAWSLRLVSLIYIYL